MTRLVPPSFEYAYGPSTVRYGSGCIEHLVDTLDRANIERALVVCGRTVGATDAVINPVLDGAGDRVAGVFAETTPTKSIDTVRQGVTQMSEVDADGLIALGGGSSMDVARAMSVLAVEEGDPRSFHATVGPSGELTVPELTEPKPPVVAVPTTLSGAELTSAAGVNYPTSSGETAEDVRAGPIYDPKIVPAALVYDPSLIRTTPEEILAASAMNGMDHGIEMLYSRHANPLTDSVAVHGLRILDETLPVLRGGDEDAIGQAAVGVYLASYGLIDPVVNANKYNIIHAFGHIISRQYPIQQGGVHAIVAPHVLEFLFEQGAGRVSLLAEAFGVTGASDPASAVVDRVVSLRDSLELPASLRSVEGLERDVLEDIAAGILKDVGVHNGPADLDLTKAAVTQILSDAW